MAANEQLVEGGDQNHQRASCKISSVAAQKGELVSRDASRQVVNHAFQVITCIDTCNYIPYMELMGIKSR